MRNGQIDITTEFCVLKEQGFERSYSFPRVYVVAAPCQTPSVFKDGMVGGVFGSIGSFGSFQLRPVAFGKFFLKQTGFEGVVLCGHCQGVSDLLIFFSKRGTMSNSTEATPSGDLSNLWAPVNFIVRSRVRHSIDQD